MPNTNVAFTAAGSIYPSRFVKISSGDFKVTAASADTDALIGISQEGTHDTPGLAGASTYAAEDGDTLMVYGDGDTPLLEIGGTVTRGDLLTSDADGKGITITNGEDGDVFCGARALESGTSGQLIRVQVNLQQCRPSDTSRIIADPGASGAIPVTKSGRVALVTAGAETRTLAAPSFAGQELLLYMKTDGGDCVVTCATTVNEAGNNTITFDNTGEALFLRAVEEGSNLRWRFANVDGAALTTV